MSTSSAAEWDCLDRLIHLGVQADLRAAPPSGPVWRRVVERIDHMERVDWPVDWETAAVNAAQDVAWVYEVGRSGQVA